MHQTQFLLATIIISKENTILLSGKVLEVKVFRTPLLLGMIQKQMVVVLSLLGMVLKQNRRLEDIQKTIYTTLLAFL